MARVYDAGPDTLTGKIVSFATKGWGSAKRKTWIKTSGKNIHLTRIKEAATPGGYRKACSSHQWLKEMQALTEDAGKSQGSNGSKIRNAGPRMDSILTINEGERSQRGIKRKLHLWRDGLIPGRPQMCLGCSEYTKTTHNHIVKCSGIEAAISGLYGGLGGHQQLEQGTHTWLDIVSNDKTLIKRPEE